MTVDDLADENTIFQIGVAPRKIDIITGETGLKLEKACSNAVQMNIEGICLNVLSLDDLITNKRASGKDKDAVDANKLESLKNEPPQQNLWVSSGSGNCPSV